MQKINKTGAMPEITAQWIKNNSKLNWNDLPFDEKQSLREKLHVEQKGLCCYCCRKVTTHSNNVSVEHLQDKHQHRKLQFSYDNLLLSCLSTKHCNIAKQSRAIKMHPLHPDCDDSVKINPLSAKLIGSYHKEDTEKSIEVLKLNDNELVYHRTNLIKMVQTYLQAFNICNSIYEMQNNEVFKDSFLKLVKDYPQYCEIEYIVKKLSK